MKTNRNVTQITWTKKTVSGLFHSFESRWYSRHINEEDYNFNEENLPTVTSFEYFLPI